MNLTRFSLHRPITVIMIILGIILLGALSLKDLPIELYPSSNENIVSIITRVRGGISPSEVERFVTDPIEEKVGGLNDLEEMTSISREAESVVMLNFSHDVDMDSLSRELRDMIQQVWPQLPQESEHPIIAPYDYQSRASIMISLKSESLNVNDLRRVVEESIKEKLLQVDGVAFVDIVGGQERKILIEINEKKRKSNGISFQEIMSTISSGNMNAMVGTLDHDQENIIVRALGQYQNLEEVSNLAINAADSGKIVRLGDLASIKDSYLEPAHYARIDQEKGVVLMLQRRADLSALALSKVVREKVASLQNEYAQIEFQIVLDEAQDIQKTIHSLGQSLLWGIALIIIVVLFILRQLSMTLLVTSIMVVTLCGVLLILKLLGLSINIMTLTGLALGAGLLTDSVIVLMDHLSQKQLNSSHDIEVRVRGIAPALWGSILTTIVVFLPLVYVQYDLRQSFGALGITIISVLLLSLVLTFMIVPLCFDRGYIQHKTISLAFLRKWIVKYIRFFGKYRLLVALVAGAFLVVAVLIFQYKGMSVDRLLVREALVRMSPAPGAKLDQVDDVIRRLEDKFTALKGVKQVSAQVRKSDPTILVKFDDYVVLNRAREELMEEAQKIVSAWDGFSVYLDQSIDSRKTKITLNILGMHDDVVTQLGENISSQLSKSGLVSSLQVTNKQKQPEYHITVDRVRASMYALSVSKIADSLHAKIRGMRASKFFEQGREVEMITRLQREDVKELKDVVNQTIVSPKGDDIYLRQVANISQNSGPVNIFHKNRYRTYQMTGEAVDENLTRMKKRLESFMGEVEFPQNYFYQFDRAFLNLIERQKQMSFAVGIAIIFVFCVLASLLRSWALPLIVMASIPLSFVGVSWVMVVCNFRVTHGVLMGIVMLAGLVVNNAILLVHFLRDALESGLSFGKAVYVAVSQRMRSIIMTTLTTILSLLPMAIGFSHQQEIWMPMARTVIGGLLVSTVLSFVLIPVMYKYVMDV